MICSPTDALNMFYGCDLQVLVMEDVVVLKNFLKSKPELITSNA